MQHNFRRGSGQTLWKKLCRKLGGMAGQRRPSKEYTGDHFGHTCRDCQSFCSPCCRLKSPECGVRVSWSHVKIPLRSIERIIAMQKRSHVVIKIIFITLYEDNHRHLVDDLSTHCGTSTAAVLLLLLYTVCMACMHAVMSVIITGSGIPKPKGHRAYTIRVCKHTLGPLYLVCSPVYTICKAVSMILYHDVFGFSEQADMYFTCTCMLKIDLEDLLAR